MQRLVAHLGQRRVHHQDQTDGDRDVGRTDRECIERIGQTVEQRAQGNAQCHCGEDPDGEVAIQEGQTSGRVRQRMSALGMTLIHDIFQFAKARRRSTPTGSSVRRGTTA